VGGLRRYVGGHFVDVLVRARRSSGVSGKISFRKSPTSAIVFPTFILLVFVMGAFWTKLYISMMYIIFLYYKYSILVCGFMCGDMVVMKFDGYVRKVGNSLGVTIPAAIVRTAGLKEAQKVEFYLSDDGKIIIEVVA
jgi:hypothetical protein